MIVVYVWGVADLSKDKLSNLLKEGEIEVVAVLFQRNTGLTLCEIAKFIRTP